jgi:hypothetical protein
LKAQAKEEEEEEDDINSEDDSKFDDEMKSTPEAALPGVGVVWLKTWGCSHNVSDSEYMAGQLAVHGYEVTEDEVCLLSPPSLFVLFFSNLHRYLYIPNLISNYVITCSNVCNIF